MKEKVRILKGKVILIEVLFYNSVMSLIFLVAKSIFIMILELSVNLVSFSNLKPDFKNCYPSLFQFPSELILRIKGFKINFICILLVLENSFQFIFLT